MSIDLLGYDLLTGIGGPLAADLSSDDRTVRNMAGFIDADRDRHAAGAPVPRVRSVVVCSDGSGGRHLHGPEVDRRRAC